MLVLISGPSGAGKSTLVHALLNKVPELNFSVSTTTRPIRDGETDGKDYHFVDDAEFDRLTSEDAFVEWAHVHDRRYGTRRDHVAAMIGEGEIPLLDLDVQGGKNVIELYGAELVSIFIFPPSWKELERRLRGRETDNDDVIRTRLDNARWEVEYAEHYGYWVVNDDKSVALDCLQKILCAEKCRKVRFPSHPLA
jgi:guanylate kinase